jgi:HlyD family secretion protein
MTQIQTDPQNDLQKNGKVAKENEPTEPEQPVKPDPNKPQTDPEKNGKVAKKNEPTQPEQPVKPDPNQPQTDPEKNGKVAKKNEPTQPEPIKPDPNKPQTDPEKNGKAKENEPTQPEQPAKPTLIEQKPWEKIPKPLLIIGAIALLAGVGYGAYRLFFYNPDPEGLELSGRIEGYETDVSAKIGGRIAQVSAREGDTVKSGQLLVQIDDSDLRAQLQGAIARVNVAKERVESSRKQLPILQAQLQQASLTTTQSTQDSQGRVLEAENAVSESRSNLVQSQANLVQAQGRQRRTNQLYAEGVVAAQQLDDDNATLGVNQAKVAAARQLVRSAQGRLTQAQATLQNTPIRAAAELQVQNQISQAQTEVLVSQQSVRDALATQVKLCPQVRRS